MPALRRNLNTTHLLYRRLLGFASDLELINNVLVTKHLPSLSCNQRHIAEAVLIGAVVRTFEKSVSRFSGDCYDRLYHGLLLATSDENPDVSVELIYAHPFTYVYGLLVEQAYLDQMQKAYDFDTLMNGK